MNKSPFRDFSTVREIIEPATRMYVWFCARSRLFERLVGG